MITDLFSRFDPVSSVNNISLNWFSSILGFIFIPLLFWSAPTRLTIAWSRVTTHLHREFKILLKAGSPGGTIIFTSLFVFIFLNNVLGLFPYIFTRTRHIAFTLTLSLPLWLAFIIFGWLNHINHIFAHLVPAGTPGALTPLIVLIETTRNIIRPGTLAIRLAANLIAGHLLLTLIGRVGPSLPITLRILLILSQILLLILESAVAVIQSYVFAALTTLYAREVN